MARLRASPLSVGSQAAAPRPWVRTWIQRFWYPRANPTAIRPGYRWSNSATSSATRSGSWAESTTESGMNVMRFVSPARWLNMSSGLRIPTPPSVWKWCSVVAKAVDAVVVGELRQPAELLHHHLVALRVAADRAKGDALVARRRHRRHGEHGYLHR